MTHVLQPLDLIFFGVFKQMIELAASDYMVGENCRRCLEFSYHQEDWAERLGEVGDALFGREEQCAATK